MSLGEKSKFCLCRERDIKEVHYICHVNLWCLGRAGLPPFLSCMCMHVCCTLEEDLLRSKCCVNKFLHLGQDL